MNRFACAEWPARARPTAPEAGALPKTIVLEDVEVELNGVSFLARCSLELPQRISLSHFLHQGCHEQELTSLESLNP